VNNGLSASRKYNTFGSLAHFSNNTDAARSTRSTHNLADLNAETQLGLSHSLLNSLSSRPIRGSSRMGSSNMLLSEKKDPQSLNNMMMLMSMTPQLQPQLASLQPARSQSSLLIEANKLHQNELMLNSNLFQLEHQQQQQQLELLRHQLVNMFYLKELKQLQQPQQTHRQLQNFGVPFGFDLNQVHQAPINAMPKSFTWNHLNSIADSSFGLAPSVPASNTKVNSNDMPIAAPTSLGTNNLALNLFNPNQTSF